MWSDKDFFKPTEDVLTEIGVTIWWPARGILKSYHALIKDNYTAKPAHTYKDSFKHGPRNRGHFQYGPNGRAKKDVLGLDGTVHNISEDSEWLSLHEVGTWYNDLIGMAKAPVSTFFSSMPFETRLTYSGQRSRAASRSGAISHHSIANHVGSFAVVGESLFQIRKSTVAKLRAEFIIGHGAQQRPFIFARF